MSKNNRETLNSKSFARGTVHGNEGATQPEVLTIEYGASCSFGGYAWKAVEEYPGRAGGGNTVPLEPGCAEGLNGERMRCAC